MPKLQIIPLKRARGNTTRAVGELPNRHVHSILVVKVIDACSLIDVSWRSMGTEVEFPWTRIRLFCRYDFVPPRLDVDPPHGTRSLMALSIGTTVYPVLTQLQALAHMVTSTTQLQFSHQEQKTLLRLCFLATSNQKQDVLDIYTKLNVNVDIMIWIDFNMVNTRLTPARVAPSAWRTDKRIRLVPCQYGL